ncbi:MAG: VOC family protein [Chloroflexota bacterium]
MPIPTTGYAHVRLTVTDITRSRAFYDEIFAFPVAFEVPPDADSATREALGFLYGGVIYQCGSGLFGLRPIAPETDHFDENRVGLDHVSFAVAGRSDLDAAATLLASKGVVHGGVKDIGAGFILEFRDPDGIALELFAPAEPAQR